MSRRLYTANDMVRIGCDDCKGCSWCCQEMGESVVLTPYDIYELTTNLGKSFDELMEDKIELYMTDGMALPNLKMTWRKVPNLKEPQRKIKTASQNLKSTMSENGSVLERQEEEKEICGFLNGEGRCSIHDFRPGLCRLFPLGRNYEIETIETDAGVQEKKGFRYFIVEDSCPRINGTKIKIEKWLGMPNLKKNETFITEWHYFCNDFKEEMQSLIDRGEDETVKKKNINMIELFYRKPYRKEQDFYEQFEERQKIYFAKNA